jgi:hypothetical protein
MISRNCNRLSLVVVLVSLSLLCAVSARAQNTADILGTVTDASGAVVPDATVTLTNTATNISQTTKASGNGEYTFTLLQPGTYSVRVEAKGFKTFSAPAVTVSTGDRARVDAAMQVGEQSTTVEVQATSTPALQTDTSSLGTLVTTQAVEDVPLNGRNITKLIQLSAGVNEGSPGSIIAGNRPDDRRVTAAFSVNGQSDSLNNNMIDGMDNNERIIGGNGVRPSVDAIQEVNISTNLYDASQGRTGGGVVDVITKSGSNSFHGSAYEFFRNRVLNTNPGYSFPSNATGGLSGVLPKPAFRQNQYGGSIGGPIRKNKTFFFTDFEEFNQAFGVPLTISVPTLCERGLTLAKLQGYTGASTPCPNGNPTTPGDFTDLSAISTVGGSSAIGAAGSGADLSNLTNATTGNPFFGLNKIGLEYFSMFPLPTGAGTLNNFTLTPTRTQVSRTIDGRIDQHFSDKDTFYGRYSIDNVATFIPNAFPNVRIDPATGMVAASGVKGVPVAPAGGNGITGPAKEQQQSLAISYVHVFNPNLLVNLKMGYARSSIRSLNANFGTNVSNALGFPCNATPNVSSPAGSCINMPGQTTASGLAAITLTVANPANGSQSQTPTYTGMGDAAFVPLLQFDNNFLYSGALTWTKGSQSIKIGLGLIRRRATIGQSNNPNGSFAFSGAYTGVPAADLLEGLSIGGTVRNYTTYLPGFRTWEPSVYMQDDWRVRKWLTLNLGLRYDIFTPFTEVHGRSTNYDQFTGLIVGASIPGAQQSNNTAGILTDYRNLAPRFGFSASLPHSLVVRGGFGLSFFPINYQSPYNLKNAPGNFQFNCAVQQANGSQNPCTGTPYDNGATAHFGTSPAQDTSSPVGKVGGYAFSAGLPAPFLNVNQVFAPSAAQCSYSGTLANYGTTCPALTDPYQSFGLTNIQAFGIGSEYLEQMNLQVQKAFGSNVITIGGVEEMGRHAPKGLSLNGISNPSQVVGGSNNPPLANAFPWLAKTTVTQNQTTSSDAYSSLQATFIRRFSKGLTTQVNYTWAHARAFSGGACTPTISPAFGNTPSVLNPCFYDNPASPGNPFQVNWYNKGFSSSNTGNDVADRVAWTVNYQLPFGKSMSGVEGAFVKGWTTNLAGSWQTGLPFTVTQNASNQTGTGAVGNPDQICSGRVAHPTITQWFNSACFVSQTVNTFGNETGGQLFGPPQRRMDFSLFKEFTVTEKVRMQFRTEVFNLFNTPNFGTPSAVVQYGSCKPKLVTCTGQNNNFASGFVTSLNTNSNSRQLQFALKVLF